VPKFYRYAFGLVLAAATAAGQSLGGAGTLKGTVRDASDAPVPSAPVELSNPVTGYSAKTRTGPDGMFVLSGIPAATYRLHVTFAGFQPHSSDITIRSAVPMELNLRLELSSQQTAITVEDRVDNLVENKAVASETIDRQLLTALPTLSPDSGLNDAIIYTTPGVAADSNGFFHPLGDHAQVTYVIDGQPVSDQRNKVFATSIPANAIQSMEVISGSTPAEYGDKTSLVINAGTRSGLGQKPFATFLANYGSFGTVGEEITIGFGGAHWGNFAALNAERSGRFLDTPEFWPNHDIGNTATFFDRSDFLPGAKDAFHLNVMAARNWLQVPNTYDQPLQDQRQKVVSFNIAPGYQHTIDAQTLFTVNAFVRRDEVRYFPSRDPLHDSPATLAQDRTLTNFGVHSDLARVQGRHNWKIGLNATQTRLNEDFRLAITDPAYNAPCLGAMSPSSPGLKNPSQCAALGLQPDPGFLSSLVPYDLTRGGKAYHFRGAANINQVALFGQDSISFGNLTLNFGIRFDRYDGLTDGYGVQPRAAFSYLFRPTNTVIRGGYSHTMETPTNENLVASSSTGVGGLASNLFQGTAEQKPIGLGRRNQYDAGIQQSLGPWLLVDVGYFRKYTRNAFDFDALFSTPITFPIGWRQSKLDGISARITSVDIHGLRIYATMGHANARFFGPENGGIIFNSNLSAGAYRQDHDQVYQQNLNLHYQPVKNGWWTDFSWRYDSGLVVGAVNNLEDALALTSDQQAVIGLFCGNERASLVHRITACNSPDYGAERIHILAPGAANPDRNPPRTTSRHIFNVAVGTDNLLHTERIRTIVRFTVLNLTNQAALYNFLSPFSGTHWVEPRSYQAQLGWAF
jgi:hypothetical protein